MGTTPSSKKRRGTVAANKVVEEPDNYQGPPTVHQLASISVVFHYNRNMSLTQSFSGVTWVTCDMDSYYGTLQQFYTNGMRMSEFLPIPNTKSHAGGMFQPGTKEWYQGIFYRDNAQPPDERWQLQINQTTLYAQMVAEGGFSGSVHSTTSDLSMLYEIVNEQSRRGARFVGVQETGKQEDRQRGGFGHVQQNEAIGLDIYLEIPQHPVKDIYVYQFIPTPIKITMSAGFGMQIQCAFDWAGQARAFCNKGWRLVSIFMDRTNRQTTRSGGFSMPETTQSCLWTFEKPKSRENDETPYYEAKVMEFPYNITARFGFSEASPSAQWDGVINEQANRGWELASVLETPSMKAGFGSATVTYVMFFQRLLNPPIPVAVPSQADYAQSHQPMSEPTSSNDNKRPL